MCRLPPHEVALNGSNYYLDEVAAALGCQPQRFWHWGIANRNFRWSTVSLVALLQPAMPCCSGGSVFSRPPISLAVALTLMHKDSMLLLHARHVGRGPEIHSAMHTPGCWRRQRWPQQRQQEAAVAAARAQAGAGGAAGAMMRWTRQMTWRYSNRVHTKCAFQHAAVCQVDVGQGSRLQEVTSSTAVLSC